MGRELMLLVVVLMTLFFLSIAVIEGLPEGQSCGQIKTCHGFYINDGQTCYGYETSKTGSTCEQPPSVLNNY